MASELPIESSSNYWPGSYQPMGMRFRRSRTSRFALNTGINFLVRTAPALARVGPLRRAAVRMAENRLAGHSAGRRGVRFPARRGGEGSPRSRPGDAAHHRARPGRGPALAGHPAHRAVHPGARQPVSAGQLGCEGRFSPAQRGAAAGFPPGEPGQGVQPALRGLLRRFGRQPREAGLGRARTADLATRTIGWATAFSSSAAASRWRISPTAKGSSIWPNASPTAFS